MNYWNRCRLVAAGMATLCNYMTAQQPPAVAPTKARLMDKIDARAQAPDEPRRPSENTLSAADKLIQEQRRAIAYLTGRVKTLEARITELEKENTELKKKLPAGKPNS